MDQLPRLGKRELICLLLFTCNYVVFVWRGFLFLLVLGMGYVILFWHSLSLPYNYFKLDFDFENFIEGNLLKRRITPKRGQNTKMMSINMVLNKTYSFTFSKYVSRSQRIKIK